MMEKEEVILKAPPRLLLGVGFLFWGAMGEYPFIGLLAAIAMEARHWTNLRWEFGEKGFVRAWQLCVVILIMAAVAFFSSSEESTSVASLALLSWLPIILLPMGLAQQYASDPGVPLTTFSYFARRKITIDRKAGRPVSLNPCQLGIPFLGITIIAAGMTISVELDLRSAFWYGVSTVVLFGIAMFFMQSGKKRPIAWGVSFLIALMIAGGLSGSAYYVYNKLSHGQFNEPSRFESARDVQTALGQIKTLQLSPKIDWRYYQDTGDAPVRLRLSTYDVPGKNRWHARNRSSRFVEKIDEARDVGGGFESLHAREGNFAYHDADMDKEFHHRSRVRGLVGDEALLPLPRNVRRFEQVGTEGIEANAMSSTRLSEPDHGALEVRMVSGDQSKLSQIDLDPSARDLQIPEHELKGVTSYWHSLGIYDLPERGKGRKPVIHAHAPDRGDQEAFQQILRAVFLRDFKYSLELEPARNTPAVSHFLNEMKEGHCEYFASSTALLLRRVGIPTRYVVGYVVEEQGKEPGEWILRGKHAHAWTQVYLGGEWVDETPPNSSPNAERVWRCRGGEWVEVDFTPPDWLAGAHVKDDWGQKLADWWEKTRADLVIWFSGAVVSVVVNVLIIGGLISLIVFVIYRLWTTRGDRREGPVESWGRRSRRDNPLADFEQWLAQRIGPRPRSVPMGRWLQNQAPELVPLYQQIRFDPVRAPELPEKLIALTKEAESRLKSSASTSPS